MAAMDIPLLVEINLISAQDLKKPTSPSSTLRSLQAYAVISLYGLPGASSPKLRTRIDRVGHSNPTWNDRFVFLLPSPSLLSPSSPSAVSVDILASGGWILPDAPLGSARILLANLRLLDRPRDVPSSSAFGIRRPSGRFKGVLNVGFTVLSHVSVRAAEALKEAGAVGYRDLMAREQPRVLKEVNYCRLMSSTSARFLKEEEEEEDGGGRGMQLCGFGG